MANIILFEANTASDDLFTAVNTARNYAGVSVVSMSWGSSEFDEASYDSYFTTPTGHNGVTFLASTGDSGSPSGSPAYSPTSSRWAAPLCISPAVMVGAANPVGAAAAADERVRERTVLSERRAEFR